MSDVFIESFSNGSLFVKKLNTYPPIAKQLISLVSSSTYQ